MRKRDKSTLPQIRSWQPSRMKTGLRNQAVGKKFSIRVLETARKESAGSQK
jgi:hypothetical protein